MRIAISHATTYSYDGALVHAVQALRLTPPASAGQAVQSWQIMAPGIESAASYTDAFGNLVHIVASRGGSSSFQVMAQGVVDTTDTGGVVGRTQEAATLAVFCRPTPATLASPAIIAMAAATQADDRLATMHNMLEEVHATVAYVVDATTPQTTAAVAFADRRGVCQDHAHIMIAAARSLGIPARYVTGYLLLDDEEAQGTGSVAHHAWAETWIDGLGWVGFDAANAQCPTERYVRLASALDAASAAPVRGVRHGTGSESMDVAVAVTKIADAQ
jgi:transglutaminase-like putative cysteine protease